MFGEPYFATRERLSNLIRNIADLAIETGTDLGDSMPLAEIEHDLSATLLLVVCGESSSGKSTLINGLCGHKLCEDDELPLTDRLRRYRHGDPARDVEVTPLLEDRYRTHEFLRNWTLVDTQDTHPNSEAPPQITEHFLATADLILFVFPRSNPWSAGTWDAISQLPAAALKQVVLIIHPSDPNNSSETQVILGHMQDLAIKRIGHAPPIFAVAGKLAYDAKQSTPSGATLLQASGFQALDEFVSKHICQSRARLDTLENGCQQATSALCAVDDRIEDQTRILTSQCRFIEQLEREIDAIREQGVAQVPSHLADIAKVFETEAIYASKVLRRKLGALPSISRLFSGDRTSTSIETGFIERLQGAVETLAEHHGNEIADACLTHWQTLDTRVQSSMGIPLDAAAPIAIVLTKAQQQFVQGLGRAARQGIGNLKIRHPLDKELRHRNLTLKSFVFMTLLLTIGGSTCGALGVPWLPAILCGLAALFFCGGILAAWTTRKSIVRDFQGRLSGSCGAFANTLRTDYEETLRVICRDYASSLDRVRTHLARETLTIDPRRRRWQESFITLKAIEQEL